MSEHHILGICEPCQKYIDAANRWEETCVARSYCAGCGKTGVWPAFKVGGYLGDPNCSDCMTMTHCETHHKVEGLYPLPCSTSSQA